MTIYLSAVLKYNPEVFVLYLSTCYFILPFYYIYLLTSHFANSDYSDFKGCKF